MIHEFSLSNFCSFADEATLSFCVGEHAPDNSLFFASHSGQRLSKMLTLIGANASGKTNFLKGLAFLRWFMLHSFRGMEAKEKIPVDSFIFTETQNSILSFRITFEIAGVIYRYHLDITRARIIREILELKTDSNFFHYLFKREWDEVSKSVDIREQDIGFDVEAIKGILRDNASLLSTLKQVENKPIQPLLEYFDKMRTNVIRWGRESHMPAEHITDILTAAEFYHRNPEYKNEAEKLLARKLDLGLSGIDIKEEKVKVPEKAETEVMFLPYGIHRVEDKIYRLSMLMESSGTQNAFVLLRQLLPVLHTGGLAVIDEFEVDLHPQMIPPILDIFFDTETNPKNAQLLFSTHSIEVLRKLDKTQVVLVEKDENCRSHVCRLDDIKGVRRDVDLYAKYMSGAFGAVPDV